MKYGYPQKFVDKNSIDFLDIKQKNNYSAPQKFLRF
jgi:hypothetical protein